jgi:hypothetical protein
MINGASAISGILVDLDSRTALRSRVAHTTSIVENPLHIFSIHCLEDGRVLIFDCESMGYPVLGTSYSLSMVIPYLVQNALATYLGCGRAQKSAFAPSWQNPLVAYTDYLSGSDKSREVSVFNVNPETIDIKTESLDQAVLAKAFHRAAK